MKLAALGVLLALAGGTEPTALPLRPRRSPPLTTARPTLAQLEPTTSPATATSRGDGPLSSEERARRAAVTDALLAAEARATEDPESAEAPLRHALRELWDVAPLVADDSRAQQARVLAQLALARTLLVDARPHEAATALDDALRTAHGQSLPVALFGPALVELHDERIAALSRLAPATLAVTCSVPCQVFLDERLFDRKHPLLPGPHRLWIEAVRPGLPVLRRELELEPGATLEIDYDVDEPAPDPIVDLVEPDLAPAPPRILPRWAAGIGIGVGFGMAAAGGGLVGVDHRCPDLSDPRQVPCLEILNTDQGGFALIGLGSAVLFAAVAILVVDEVRARRARKSG